MRSVTLVLAVCAVCTVYTASPALAQARILVVQAQPPQPVQTPPMAAGHAAPAQDTRVTPPVSPQLGPPVTVPAASQKAQKDDMAPAAASKEAPPPVPPQQTQVEPPRSAHPKTPGRIEAKSKSEPLPPSPLPAASRYSFNRVSDGFLRLDKATGQIAYCSPRAADWSCQAVPVNRAGLRKEVTRLHKEVARLHDDVTSLRRLQEEMAALKKLQNEEVATRKKLQDEVAGLKRLRDEVATLKKLPEEVGSLKKLEGEVAGLKKLQHEVVDLKSLKDEVAALKKEIAALRPPPPLRPPGLVPPPGAPGKNGSVQRPSTPDLAGARAYIAYTWQRLVDMINQIQKDMMGRREGNSANGLSRT